MRLIDADELKEALAKNITIWTFNVSYDGILAEIIDNAPTVKTFTLLEIEENYRKGLEKGLSEWETERPQGKWIRTGSLGNGNAHYECSNCHYGDEHAESQEVPYCWHCGADMRGEKK